MPILCSSGAPAPECQANGKQENMLMRKIYFGDNLQVLRELMGGGKHYLHGPAL